MLLYIIPVPLEQSPAPTPPATLPFLKGLEHYSKLSAEQSQSQWKLESDTLQTGNPVVSLSKWPCESH